MQQCQTGYEDCDGNAQNGCEAITGGDPENCGACGVVCDASAPQVTETRCRMGQCEISECEPGRFDRDETLANGCESITDPTCPDALPESATSCAAGLVGIDCYYASVADPECQAVAWCGAGASLGNPVWHYGLFSSGTLPACWQGQAP